MILRAVALLVAVVLAGACSSIHGRRCDLVPALRRAAFALAVMLSAACDSGRRPQPAPATAPRLGSDAAVVIATPDTALDDVARHSPAELDTVDLDGDGAADPIDVSFTGGAHCCYTLAVTPSRTGKLVAFPFELDGGYVRGLDLSNPAHFNIADYDGDGQPEICAEIGTYNGEPARLPAAWRQPWGFKTHVIEIRFASGEVAVRDHGSASCATP